MPSARDLLQQADALMRSHRNLGASNGQETVPVLTDVAIPGGATVVTRQRVEEIPVLTNVVTEVVTDVVTGVDEPAFDLTVPVEPAPAPYRFPPTQTDPLLLPLSEMPPMPQIEEDDSIIAYRTSDKRIEKPVESAAPIDDDMPKWLEADLLDTDPIDVRRAPADVAPFAPERLDWESMPTPSADALSGQATPIADAQSGHATPIADALSVPGTPMERFDATGDSVDEPDVTAQPTAAAPEIVDAAALAAGEEPEPASEDPEQPSASSAGELAETVYFQVLQNLDLYTERALQQHMTAHLSPIIERATQELLATLNANLGALMRQFVADAIEKQLGVRPASDKPTPEA